MRARLQNTWENSKASLWFIPTLFVVAALVVSSFLIELDGVLQVRRSGLVRWLVSGTPDAARGVLAVIAGSLITAISIAYSISIVAIQQTSAQFSPRVLRTFTADRGNQRVLGAYIGTFIYALLVMRQIREAVDDAASFVPALSLITALIFALSCLGLLIYFIHHISQLLQVSVIIDHVHRDLIQEIERLYPAGVKWGLIDVEPSAGRSEPFVREATPQYLRSTREGFLRSIDDQTLVEGSDGSAAWVWVKPQVGDYIPSHGVLAVIAPEAALDEDQLDQLREAFVLDIERTMHQDPLFGIRQLVDIGLKALSPAINDPTTAEYCLSHLGDALSRLGQRAFPSNERVGVRGETRYVFSRPTWEDFVEAAFAQIRHQAADNLHVTAYLVRVLQAVASCLPPGDRAAAIQRELDGIRYGLDKGQFSPTDTGTVRRLVEAAEATLRQPAPPQARQP